MQSLTTFSERGASPVVPLEELGSWLLGAAAELGGGLIIGLVAARMLTARQLHWSWAAVCVPPTALLWAGHGAWTFTLAVASVTATRAARRRHNEDVASGGDLARIAAGRRGPLSLLEGARGRAELHRRRLAGPGGWHTGREVVLAVEEPGRIISVPCPGEREGRHMLVVGATGSGKTVTQTWLVVRAIEQGAGAVVVDPKGDPQMRADLRRAADTAGRRFLEWTPDGPCVYNPYARGGETEIADKALAGERFTEPHYLRQAQRYLGHLVRALRRSDVEVSLHGIVDNLDPDRLEVLARSLPEPQAGATHDYLDSLTARQRADLAGVRDRLAILAESDVGVWLDPQANDSAQFDLLQATEERAVVYFDLQSDSRPLLAQILGAAIVQDLQTTVAALQGRPVPTVVAIDEFSAVSAEHVVRLFGRARSAGVSLLLGTQELSDLRVPGRERLLEQVMGNLSVLVAHRQVVPASAELIASLAGSRGAWRVASHSDGRSTRTRTREAVLDADEVRNLGTGWAAVLVVEAGGGVRIGRVLRPA